MNLVGETDEIFVAHSAWALKTPSEFNNKVFLGISQEDYFAKHGDKATVDDGLALHFTKKPN